MTTPPPQPIIQLSDVSFAYGEQPALSCVNLSVYEGDYLGVIGPNGAGKTTLLKIILGLFAPTKGVVSLFGHTTLSRAERAQIGYVPQKTTFFDAHFPATVYEVVSMGRYGKRGLFRMLNNEDHSRINEALMQVNLLELRDRQIGNLSGGQQQRVFIARALAGEPKILFLDEPTVGIDHASQKDFYVLIKQLHANRALTIVLVSHDIGTVTKEATRLAYVDGTLSYYSSPATFLAESAKHAFIHGHDH